MLAPPSGEFFKQYRFCAKFCTVKFFWVTYSTKKCSDSRKVRKVVFWYCGWHIAVWQCNRMQVSNFIFVQLKDFKNCLIAVWSPIHVHCAWSTALQPTISASLLLRSKSCLSANSLLSWLAIISRLSSSACKTISLPFWNSNTVCYVCLRSAAGCSCCSAWQSCGICLRRSGWN